MAKINDISKIYQAVIDGELEITPKGEIWRLSKRGWCRWLEKTIVKSCKKVRAEHNTGRYLGIRTMYDGKRVCAGAHRLVYFHFHGEIPENLTVNHKDGNTKNNHPDNLELMTSSEQALHSIHVLGKVRHQNGEKNSMAKLSKEQVLEIIQRRKNGEQPKALAKEYGIASTYIWTLVNKRSWKHLFND